MNTGQFVINVELTVQMIQFYIVQNAEEGILTKKFRLALNE